MRSVLLNYCLAAGLLLAGGGLLAAGGALADPATTNLQTRLSQTDCHLKGLADKVHCFTLQVPENPAQPQGAQLTLHAARIPAFNQSKLAPLAVLAGGPGQSAIDIGGRVGQAFAALRAERDILLLEQRGTGQSNGLKCQPDSDSYHELAQDLDFQQLTRDCLADFAGDLRQYNTPNAVHDWARMVRALGYPQVHLYGGSYGSRAALVFMRLYPELIASVTLDGMAPVQAVVGPFASHGARALDLLFTECEQTPACQQSYPTLRADYWQLWARVSAKPIEVEIAHPSTLKPHTLRLDAAKLFGLSLNFLYSQQQRQLLPYALSQASQDNFVPLAGLMAALGQDNGIYQGLMINIICNEDIRRASPAQLADDTHTPFGDISVRLWQQQCQYWPAYALPEQHFAPVQSDIPVLALSGRLDPVTPPAWGELTTQGLGKVQHLVADQGAHIVALRGCGPKLVQQFINAPGEPLQDTGCLNELPGAHFMRNANAQ